LSNSRFFIEDLVLRDCDENDIPAITAIYAHAVLNGSASFEIVPPGEAEMKIRRRLILIAKYPFLVAEHSGKLVGFAYANTYNTRAAYSKTVENSIYVREGMQRLGIGRKLLFELIHLSTDAGFRQMIAVIGDSANVASVRLHEKLGFKTIGTMNSVGWKNGRWLDVVLMQLALGSGDQTPL
jgi:phosphinothricin acetyltransferase